MVKSIVSLSDRAASYIQAVMTDAEQTGKPVSGLRIGVKKGGCSGHEYDFSYAEAADHACETVEDKGITLFIDRAAVLFVIGSELDYEQDDFAEKLVFRNPNETSACGCGKSVSFS